MAINQINNNESGFSVRNKLNQTINIVNLGVTTGVDLVGSELIFNKNNSNTYTVDLSNLDWTGGTNYILVKAEGTDEDNAQELQDAYDLAVSMSASISNRITIVAAPGNYYFSSDFEMDEEYIDLVSLDGNRSIIFNGNGTIDISGNNTIVKGVDVLTKPFKIGHNLDLIIENCKGGNNSFGYADSGTDLTIKGTFINCEGGNNSFGHRPNIGPGIVTLTISGKFIDCIAGSSSFGFFFINSQTTLNITGAEFINCNTGASSFGSSGQVTGAGSSISILGSKFINCKSSGQYSFGVSRSNNVTNLNINSSGNNEVQTVFENCEAFGPSFGAKENSSITTNVVVGGNVGANSNPYRVLFKNCISKLPFSSPPQLTGINSFGGFGALNFVELINCRAGDNSFGLTISGSRLENCIGGNNSFGKNDVDGTFLNCVGGDNSFGGDGGTASGTFNNCKGGDYSFGGSPSSGGIASGTFKNCEGGDYSFGGSDSSGGIANGTFKDCIGGDESFGSLEVSGTFINCEAGDGSFGFGGYIDEGVIESCKSGDLSFGSVGIGVFNSQITTCKSGDNSFGFNSFVVIDSEFDNCIGGDESFGFDSLDNQGKYYRCRLTDGTFDVPDLGGFVVLGIDGNNDVQNITGV